MSNSSPRVVQQNIPAAELEKYMNALSVSDSPLSAPPAAFAAASEGAGRDAAAAGVAETADGQL